MNINEFERTKPVETYYKLESMLNKYQTMANNTSAAGSQLLLESNGQAQSDLVHQLVRELSDLKQTFLSGR